MNQNNTLPQWLFHLETIHGQSIDMTLDRIRQVSQRMKLTPSFPLIIVGGTNGKGSVCAMLSSILYQAGYNVGTYTSPHIHTFNERIATNLQPMSDQQIVNSFTAIEQARGDISLTYFEFSTLAAMHLFITQHVDVGVMEIGLGGRLDALNIYDADIAIITNIDLDHCEYLGHTREAIGHEKAGIFRPKRPAICGDTNPPNSLINDACQTGAQLYLNHKDFDHETLPDGSWSFTMGGNKHSPLPAPKLQGDFQMGNAAIVLAALQLLHNRLPVSLQAIHRGLTTVCWPGRFQIVHTAGQPELIFDVGHNPHAVKALVSSLKTLPKPTSQKAVFSILKDKDIDTVLTMTHNVFNEWYIGGLPELPRGMSKAELAEKFAQRSIRDIYLFDTVLEAWLAALSTSKDNDRIVIFGSFHTVAAIKHSII